MDFSFDYFNKGLVRTGTRCEKWDVMRAQHGQDILPLWVADMDFPSPPAVAQALIKRAEHPTYGYTEPMEDDYQAIIDFWSRRHHLTLAKEQISLLPCVVTGIRPVFQRH